jgi:hypothetical protein
MSVLVRSDLSVHLVEHLSNAILELAGNDVECYVASLIEINDL